MKFWRRVGIISLCIAATMTWCSGTFAADTLQEALKGGTIGGEAKIWYQTNDSDVNKRMFDAENSWFDAGLRLSYLTDTYMGFRAALSFYAVDDLGAYERWADGSMMGAPHGETWTWLGEAYISYEIANTSARLGRQNINTPLVNSDDWPIFPNNFEAVVVKNKDLADTTLLGGYIWRERWRGSEDFEDFHDDLAMLGVVNQSLPNTTMTGYFYWADDDYNTNYNSAQPTTVVNHPGLNSEDDTMAFYADLTTKIEMFHLALQYIRIVPNVDYISGRSADDTNAAGAKVGVKIGPVDLAGAYSWVGDGYFEAAKLSDNRCKTPLYTSTISGDGDIAGRPRTQTGMVSAAISPIDKLNLMVRYAYHSFDDSSDYRKLTERHLGDGDGDTTELICKFTGLENVTLWGALWYSNHESCGVFNGKGGDDLVTFRMWARYMF